MTNLDKYLEIRDKVIRPALEELIDEYEADDYECSIGTEKPPSMSSGVKVRRRGSKPGRIAFEAISLYGAISFTRTDTDDNTKTVSIFSSDGNLVIFMKLPTGSRKRIHLDELTPERVKEEVRKILG